MNRSGKLHWLCLLLIWCLVNGITAAGFEFSAADYRDSDINFKPFPLVAGRTGEVMIRLRNQDSSSPLGKARIVIADRDSGEVLNTTEAAETPAGAEQTVVVPCTIDRNGWHELAFTVEIDGRKYEQALTVPVVSRPLYFPWFGGTEPHDPDLRYANVVLVHEKHQADYWNRRGAITCLGKNTIQDKDSPAQYARYLAADVTAKNARGIMIDEVGGYSDEEITSGNIYQGIVEFTRNEPELFSALWVCGALRASYCNITKNPYRRQGVDLILVESYANYLAVEFCSPQRYRYFDQRIDMIRQQDILSNAVMTMGIVGHEDKFNLSSYEIEDEVRYVKRHAPEMPGIGFFHSFGPDRELTRFSDELCRKYYIEPVIQIYEHDLQLDPVTPKAGEKITLYARVYNLGGMDAAGVKVRFLIDGKALGESTIDLPAAGERVYPAPVAVSRTIELATGYHRFRVELEAAEGVTILDGAAEREILVREQ